MTYLSQKRILISNTYFKNVKIECDILISKTRTNCGNDIRELDVFNIPYTEDQKLFSNVAVSDFESICVPREELKATETTTWVRKHVPISVSISSNLQVDPMFSCEKDLELLINDFVFSLDLLAEKSKLQMRIKFQDIENTVNDRIKKISNRSLRL